MNSKKKRPAQKDNIEKPLPKKAYPLVDTDLGRDNIENDYPASDVQDLDNL